MYPFFGWISACKWEAKRPLAPPPRPPPSTPRHPKVGSGKSSLVSALLGEMTKVEGRVSVDGSVAYVAQTAWIINATLKDNVLMGRALDEERYQKVLEVCDMKQVRMYGCAVGVGDGVGVGVIVVVVVVVADAVVVVVVVDDAVGAVVAVVVVVFLVCCCALVFACIHAFLCSCVRYVYLCYVVDV